MNKPLYVLLAVAGKNTKLKETLNSLSQCHKPSGYVATIVVENGTKYNAETIVQCFSSSHKVRYLYHSKANKSSALNFAIAHINEDDALLFMTDDDAEFDPHILEHYAAYAARYPESTYFGGKMLPKYEHSPPSWLLHILPTSSSPWPPDHFDMRQNHRFLGINWAAHLRDLRQIGGFDTRFGPGTVPRRVGQEHNMQDRMSAAGLQAVFIPEAIVWHYVPKEKSDLQFARHRSKQFGIRKGIELKNKGGGIITVVMKALPYFVKTIWAFIMGLFTFSRKKFAQAIADTSIGMGIIRGYFIR